MSVYKAIQQRLKSTRGTKERVISKNSSKFHDIISLKINPITDKTVMLSKQFQLVITTKYQYKKMAALSVLLDRLPKTEDIGMLVKNIKSKTVRTAKSKYKQHIVYIPASIEEKIRHMEKVGEVAPLYLIQDNAN